MARPRTKKRTHVRVNNAASGPGKPGATNRPPKSMVIRMGAGEVGGSVSRLVTDFRAMMEPDTASRLKERRSNKLKDYTSMAGPLGVTHLFLFSKSKLGNMNLRIGVTPRGPTLSFRIEKYSLCKDIIRAQKHPRAGGKEYLTPPLLVINNLMSPENEPSSDPRRKDLENLTRGILQNIFPPISAQSTPLASIKRIMLWNREQVSDGGFVMTLRHYSITTKRAGVSKRIRRFDPQEQRAREKKGHALPNLGKLDDVADYLLDPSAAGYTSASETEVDTDNEIEVLETSARKVLSKREVQKMQDDNGKIQVPRPERHVEKRAVKLVELGPRMRLRLVKVQEGLCDGRVMWNEYVTKTKAEEEELEEKWQKRRKEKEQRKQEQNANVEKKRALKVNTKRNAGSKDKTSGGDDADEDKMENDQWDSEDLEDYDGSDPDDMEE